MHKTTCASLEHTRPGKEASPEARRAFEKLLKKQKVRSHPEIHVPLYCMSGCLRRPCCCSCCSIAGIYAALCNRMRIVTSWVNTSVSVQM